MDLREITEFLKDTSKYLIILVVMIFLFLFVVAFVPIAGNSMFPTLEEGDVVIVSKLTSNYQRNSIIVFKDSNGKSYVKRIIGLPGEEVHYLNGYLYINGEVQKETFLDDDIVTSNFLFEDICDTEKCPDGVIPDDMYLVLGDNRPESVDSRDPDIGLVSKDNIDGIVKFRVWPISSFGNIK